MKRTNEVKTAIVLEAMRKTETGYEAISRALKTACKGENIIEFLNTSFNTTTRTNGNFDVMEFFAEHHVTWEYDIENDIYFSRYDDGVVTGEAFKVTGTVEYNPIDYRTFDD